MEMAITFPGNKRVNADFGGFTVETDQSLGGGGDGSAPAPFDLFLASIGTCAGVYALGFMQKREIPTEGMRLSLIAERDPQTHMVRKITLDLQLPPEFPEKYREAVVKAMDLCAVKRHIAQPPEFVITTAIG
jgi:putative redox protein